MQKHPGREELTSALIERLLRSAAESESVSGPSHAGARGATLRPGAGTPLWNLLRQRVQPHLEEHGAQAKLGRLLGLHRQAVNAYFTRGSRMPDAERTLRILAWLLEREASRAEA